MREHNLFEQFSNYIFMMIMSFTPANIIITTCNLL